MGKDISGCTIFEAGEVGQLHVVAHQMLDRGREAEGYHRLSRALRDRTGSGSDWVHIQWHLLVFELAMDRWHEARARFDREILPAVGAGDALTDGPAALWRLSLSTHTERALPWDRVHAAAVANLGQPAQDPFITLHHLLALAGAGDHLSIDAWLQEQRRQPSAPATLQTLAAALHAYISGNWWAAVASFEAAAPQLGSLGGSHAQNGLFGQLCTLARGRLPLGLEAA